MENFPRVAILVLNYNGEDCLPRCLSSLTQLTYQNYQVVVVDNGSTDRSFGQAKNNFPNFVFLEKKTNTGFAAGMNTGIAYAKEQQYDFVWLMNYDAEVFPETLSLLIEAYQENPQRQALSPVIQDTEGNTWFAGGFVNYARMRTEHQRKVLGSAPYQTRFLTGCAPLFHTRLLEEVGMFDERFFLYYEDADLSARIQKSGHGLFVVPKAIVLHAEKSSTNPKKLYYLVHFGLLFFALHTPAYLRPYIIAYVTIRRIVNRIKLLLRLPGAEITASAYADYFRKFQAGDQLYLHKLS